MQPLRQCASRQAYARSFQQLCRSHTASRVVQRCAFSTTKLLQAKGNEPEADDDDIHYYEQEFVQGKHGAIRRVGGPRNLEKRIKQLEEELEALKSGESLDWLPETDRDGIRHEIREARRTGVIKDEKLVSSEEMDELLGPQPEPEEQVKALLAEAELEEAEEEEADSPKVELRLPDVQTKSLEKLNKALRDATSSSPPPNASRLLWQSYRACKQNVPGVLQGLPPSAWRVLWDSQYDGALSDDVRAKHLWILLDDMITAGQPLNPVQQVVRVEGHIAAGRLQKAMKWWDKSRPELERDEQVAGAFLALGPRIKADLGDVDAAEKLALEIARARLGGADAFMPVIETLLQEGTKAAASRAAGMYVKLRCAVGTGMRLADFDRLAMSFLQHGQADVALGIFKDLLSFSRKSADTESTAAYKTSMRLYDDIIRDAETKDDAAAELNARAMQTLSFLPRSFQNKFFYASWLKRLIGLGALDTAAQVVRLMSERGVRPDPIHLNGLMSAWLRGGRPADVDTALKLGHAMVQRRISAVAAHEARADQPAAPDRDAAADLPAYLARAVPAGTIETFSILLLHYSQHDMRASIAALQSALHAARLEPNAFFLNHLLRSHQRAHDAVGAWQLFSTSQHNRVRPDLETFACLWDMCRWHVERHNPGSRQTFPTPRGLFGHMQAWLATQRARALRSTRDQVTPEFYAQIVRCFFLARDLRGCLVALHALRDSLAAHPDAEAAQCVAALVAAVGDQPRSTRAYLPGVGRVRIRGAKGAYLRKRRGLVGADEQGDQARSRVAALLAAAREARRQELQAEGVPVDDLGDQARAEERLHALAAFLRECLRERAVHIAALRSQGGEEGVGARVEIVGGEDEKLEQVAFEMGAGGVRLGARPVYEQRDGAWEVAGWEEDV